jgi:hypothetical protein
MHARSTLSILASTVLSLGVVLTPVGTAVASGGSGAQPVASSRLGCPSTRPQLHVKYVKRSTRHTVVGKKLGAYNAAKKEAPMTLTLTATTTKRSAWEVGGEASLGWGIAQVKAHANHTAELSSTRGESLSLSLPVPPKHWAYMVPKVQTKAYRIYVTWDGADCKAHKKKYGTVRAVVADLEIDSCITRKESGCQP